MIPPSDSTAPALHVVASVAETAAVKSAANEHDLQSIGDALARIEAVQGDHTQMILNLAAAVDELLRRVP